MVVKKGFSSYEWRRALEDAEQILQPHSNLKINQEIEEEILQPLSEIEEFLWDVFTGEILPRLSTKQLQTFKIVCKKWLRMISSPYFVRLHLNIYNQSQIRVLMPGIDGVMEYKYSNINSGRKQKQHIRYPPEIGEWRNRVLGSCDGLLCFSLKKSNNAEYTFEIALYNPSTGKYKYFKVPFGHENSRVFNCSWFGRHPCSGEYVLVLVTYFTEFCFQIGFYNLSTTDSELKLIHSTVPFPFFYYCSHICTLLHEALHWPAQRHNRSLIFAYHLDSKNCFEISAPVQYCGFKFKLGVVEGCLFAILNSNAAGVFEMWILKEYGVQQSWTKYANIQGFNCYRVFSPLGFLPDGDLVLDVDQSKLIKYNFNHNKAVLLTDHNSVNGAIMCADSLVSPTIVRGGVE